MLMEPQGNLEQRKATLNIKLTNKNSASAVTIAKQALKTRAGSSRASPLFSLPKLPVDKRVDVGKGYI